jgi:hypothetical protein
VVRGLPDVPHRAAPRAVPEGKFAAMKRVNIRETLYQGDIRSGSSAPSFPRKSL